MVAQAVPPPPPAYEWRLPPGFPVPSVPADNPMTPAKVELGRRLFHDRSLSGNGTYACSSCHRQELAFTDGRGRAVGSTGETHPRSAMSLANVAYGATLTWADPGLTRLEDQARTPMLNEHPVELGLSGREREALRRLRADPDYPRMFSTAFPEDPDPISLANVTRALASFERTLVSGDSPYDRLVYRDDAGALSGSARRGMRLFFSERLSCSRCHGGFTFSGPVAFEGARPIAPAFHNNGLFNLGGDGGYPADNPGLFSITGRREDMGRFRAPTLRNIELTAPYMHDGVIATLVEVIEHYARGGRLVPDGPLRGDGRDSPRKSDLVRGFDLDDRGKADLVEFLKSLTDRAFVTDPRFAAPTPSPAGAVSLSGQAPSVPEWQLALVGGTIYTSPADDPIRDGVVLIRDGTIAAVGKRRAVKLPRGVAVLDCSGMTVTAGFWNSHVHFFERKWSNAAALPAPELGRQIQDMVTRYGFTSVFDIGSMWENTRRIRERVESGEVPGPRIRTTGEALLAPGAVPPDNVIRMLGFMTSPSHEIADAAQATAASRRLIDAGVDGIKVHLQPPPPPGLPFPESAIPAAVDEAHRSGKPVFLHPNSGADVLAAARAGVDVIAHTTPRSGPWDETLLSAMKERRVALTPTLSAWRYLLRHERVSTQETSVSASVGQLRAWVTAGGTVLFGNDLGAVDYDPGEEYALMAEAGMSLRQILASMTTAPAERFGDAQRLGRVAPGFIADLAILGEDPSRNIRALAAVRTTIRDGKVIYPPPGPGP